MAWYPYFCCIVCVCVEMCFVENTSNYGPIDVRTMTACDDEAVEAKYYYSFIFNFLAVALCVALLRSIWCMTKCIIYDSNKTGGKQIVAWIQCNICIELFTFYMNGVLNGRHASTTPPTAATDVIVEIYMYTSTHPSKSEIKSKYQPNVVSPADISVWIERTVCQHFDLHISFHHHHQAHTCIYVLNEP